MIFGSIQYWGVSLNENGAMMFHFEVNVVERFRLKTGSSASSRPGE
jgi:hypothetical protein